MDKTLTETELVKYLNEAMDRLAYVSGVATGLAEDYRREEMIKFSKLQLDFIGEVRSKLEEYI